MHGNFSESNFSNQRFMFDVFPKNANSILIPLENTLKINNRGWDGVAKNLVKTCLLDAYSVSKKTVCFQLPAASNQHALPMNALSS